MNHILQNVQHKTAPTRQVFKSCILPIRSAVITKVSQGSVYTATRLGCDGYKWPLHSVFTAMSPILKEFRESVNSVGGVVGNSIECPVFPVTHGEVDAAADAAADGIDGVGDGNRPEVVLSTCSHL